MTLRLATKDRFAKQISKTVRSVILTFIRSGPRRGWTVCKARVGLLKLARDVAGMQKKDKFGVAIFSPNRPEWVITDLALHAYNLY
ncbi:hypothetical protein V1523DRAFT_44188, partial [Lipomyces doorenjongii]